MGRKYKPGNRSHAHLNSREKTAGQQIPKRKKSSTVKKVEKVRNAAEVAGEGHVVAISERVGSPRRI